MKYLNGEFYVEVKSYRYKIHPTEKTILRKQVEPKSLRTQYQVQNGTQIRRNQKVIKNDNDELTVKNHSRNKQPIQQQQKLKPPNCPSCKRNIRSKFDKSYKCRNCEYKIDKQKHQIDKNVRRQDHNLSIRLPYADRKITDIRMNMVNTTYNPTKDMFNKLQELKGKTKLKFFLKKSKYYNETKNIKFQSQEDPFSKNAQGINKNYYEVLLVMKFLQTEPQFKNMSFIYYLLYYTVIKNRYEKEIVDNRYENNDNDYPNYEDLITPKHYIGVKSDNMMLR